MSIIGKIFGISALFIMLIGFIPLFGWLNWIAIPLGILGLLFSSLGDNGGKLLNGIVLIFSILRLIFGGGIL